MQIYQGTPIYDGIASAKIYCYEGIARSVNEVRTNDTKAEILRYEKAQEVAACELKMLCHSMEEAGDKNSSIFDMQAMLIEDEKYNSYVKEKISLEKSNAEYAVKLAEVEFTNMFEKMDDTYLKARALDIVDISGRLIRILSGDKSTDEKLTEPAIVVAKEIVASDILTFDKNTIAAFIVNNWNGYSHAAILLKNMGIPVITGIDFLDELDGKSAIVNGYNGKLYIEPENNTLETIKTEMASELKEKKALNKFIGKETITKNGKKIKLYANIDIASDAEKALLADAEGIGLYRSEYLFLKNGFFPSEEEQIEAYSHVAKVFHGKEVIIRTFDIGEDKGSELIKINDACYDTKLRGIQFSLANRDKFKTQLRAILRATCYGNISVMYPMIRSVEEITEVQEILKEAVAELMEQKVRFSLPKQGIMIETKEAVGLSRELAEHVDFFSVGTNDLIRYALGIDRQNTVYDVSCSKYYKAVIDMIQDVVSSAHRAGIEVGICGEMAADLTITEQLINIGFDEISVSPSMVLKLRQKITNIC